MTRQATAAQCCDIPDRRLSPATVAREHPAHYRVMFGSGFDRNAINPELAEEGPAAFQTLAGALVEQQRKGLVHADDPLTQARFVWSIVHGIAMLTLDGAFEAEGADVAALTRYALERLGTDIGKP